MFGRASSDARVAQQLGGVWGHAPEIFGFLNLVSGAFLR